MTRTEAPVDSAIEQAVHRLAPELLRYFLRRVHPADSAADCVGEVLLVVWRRRSRFPETEDAQRAWCFGIAHHVLANHYRSASRRVALTERLREELRRSGAAVTTGSGELADALAQLGSADRELVLLVAWEGLSLGEAASALGIRYEAARKRYARAREKLRGLMTR